ncbi:phosphopantetheine-binding protein, partial [Paenibacillus sp. KS1]|uniref:phosphopantetheine-binding protein n=1 Tax=Paenibacillus sp. KS1 TaxID=1849249 RepID=UPI000A713A84
FDIGGHSLRAMTLVSRIHQTLEAEVPLRQLFLSPTIESLAAALEAAEGSVFEALVPAPAQAAYPLSSAQKRLYVLQQL